jgi:hypothetical protein
MSQVEKRDTTKLSRRSALAGLSLLATASVARTAAGAVLAPGDDAELLALAPQFEPLYAEWLELTAIEQTRQAKFDALLAPRMQARLGDAEYSREEYWAAYRDALDEINRDGLDTDNEDLPWDDFFEEFFPLFHEIFSYIATTREGLALQVKAMICRDMDRWLNEERDHKYIGTFIESVCLLVGVEFPRYVRVASS